MSKTNPDIHPWARADLRHQFGYLQAAYAGPATLRKFIRAVREAKNKIRDNPRTWSFAPGSKRVRKVQILDFRMQAFYTIQRNGVPLILEFAGPGLQPRWVERL
jgi:plasmid stabilization system protein ParE